MKQVQVLQSQRQTSKLGSYDAREFAMTDHGVFIPPKKSGHSEVEVKHGIRKTVRPLRLAQ